MNLFSIPVFSFVPGKYRKLVKESGGKIFGALLICFILLGLINIIPVIFGLREVTDALEQECPYFALQNGTLSMEKPILIDENGRYLRIDDSVESVTVYDVDALSKGRSNVLLLGRSEGGIYESGTIRVFKYKDLGDLSFDKNTVFDTFLPILKWSMIAMLFLAPFVVIGLYYLVALILQFLTGALSGGVFKTPLSSTERFRITVLAKLPPYVLVTVLKYFGIFTGFAADLLLQIAFITLVLYFYSKDDGGDCYADDCTYAD